MHRFWMISAALVVVAGGVLAAADVQSGLQVGDAPGAFNVKDITGPMAGKSLCYRCRYGGRPVVSIFAREVTDDLASLVKKIDEKVGQNGDQQMAAFVVLLSEDADSVAPKLADLAKQQEIKNVPLTIFDGEAGPTDYKIAEDAAVTVMMWVGSEVKANQSFASADLDTTQIDAVVADTSKILE